MCDEVEMQQKKGCFLVLLGCGLEIKSDAHIREGSAGIGTNSVDINANVSEH